MQTRAPRIDTEMISAFSDGLTTFRGLVANISKTGLKITNIPDKFKPANRVYSTIVTSSAHKFKFKILPVWFNNQSGNKLEVGFKIMIPPARWHDFLDQQLASESP